MIAGLVAAAVGATSPPVYELRWTRAAGAEGCVDREALAARVAERLGRPVFVAGAGAVVVDASVAPATEGWQVDLVVRGVDGVVRGERSLALAGGDCRAIDEPLALILALLVDLDARATVPPPPTSTTRWRGEASLTVGAGVGVMPGVGPGVRGQVRLAAPGLWPVAFGGSWWPARERAARVAGEGATLVGWAIDVGVCPLAGRRGRVALGACARVALGRLDVRGHGFDSDREASATLVLPAAAGRAALAVGGVEVIAEVSIDVPLTRPRFVFADPATMVLHRVAPVAGSAALGLGLHF